MVTQGEFMMLTTEQKFLEGLGGDWVDNRGEVRSNGLEVGECSYGLLCGWGFGSHGAKVMESGGIRTNEGSQSITESINVDGGEARSRSRTIVCDE